MIAYLTSSKFSLDFRSDCFLTFGTFFNLRIREVSGVRQYSCILSMCPAFQAKKREIFKNFLEASSLYQDSTLNHKFDHSLKDAIALVIKHTKGSGFGSKLIKSQHNQQIFDLRGPFGQGLGIRRFSYGLYCLLGMGTGCNVYIDFVEFLARKLMFDYAS